MTRGGSRRGFRTNNRRDLRTLCATGPLPAATHRSAEILPATANQAWFRFVPIPGRSARNYRAPSRGTSDISPAVRFYVGPPGSVGELAVACEGIGSLAPVVVADQVSCGRVLRGREGRALALVSRYERVGSNPGQMRPGYGRGRSQCGRPAG